MRYCLKLIIFSIFVAVVFGIPAPKSTNPFAIELDNNVSVVISCKKIRNEKCETVSVVAKLSNQTVPYTNEVNINGQMPNRREYTTFAAARIDETSLVVTGLTGTRQYIFVIRVSGIELNIEKMLPPISAINVVSTDITPIAGFPNQFLVVADLNGQRKVGKVTETTFETLSVASTSSNSARSTLTGNKYGAFLTEARNCANSQILYFQYNNLAHLADCSFNTQDTCSQRGRERVSFVSDRHAIWSLINTNNAYLYRLNAPSASYSTHASIAAISPNRSWNQNSPLANCARDIHLYSFLTRINLRDPIIDLQTTIDFHPSPPEVAVSLIRNNPNQCSIEGHLYKLNPDFTLTRMVDANHQIVNLPSVPCADLGFDRINFHNQFALLRYDYMRIDLQPVFPNLD